MTRFIVFANPSNRRVSLFSEAMREAGLGAPEVVSWLEVLRTPERLDALSEAPALVRIDSFGEDFEVERELLARGGFKDAATYEERRGEVIAPAVAHRGFQRVMTDVLKPLFAKRKKWTLLNPLDEIDEFFDKRRTARRFLDAGIPVPEFLEGITEKTTPAEVLDAAREKGWRQIFVKPAMGSSASGVLLVSVGARNVEIRTSLEWDAPRWFNNLRLSHYRTPEETNRALAFILSQGAQVERAIPKGKLDDAFFDCRVLCIAGEPRFIVVRQSKHAITNLHLGGWRGDVEQLKAALVPGAWDSMLATCRKLAALYRSLHIGLDVMFEADLEAHRVIEANAFGDLFPGALLDGKSVYRWEIDEALRVSAQT